MTIGSLFHPLLVALGPLFSYICAHFFDVEHTFLTGKIHYLKYPIQYYDKNYKYTKFDEALQSTRGRRADVIVEMRLSFPLVVEPPRSTNVVSTMNTVHVVHT